MGAELSAGRWGWTWVYGGHGVGSGGGDQCREVCAGGQEGGVANHGGWRLGIGSSRQAVAGIGSSRHLLLPLLFVFREPA